MNRTLSWINLAGVLLLAGLCAFQWRANRGLQLEVGGLEKRRIDLEKQVSEQEGQLKGMSADLEELRGRVIESVQLLREKDGRVRELELLNSRLEAERDHLREAITNWAQAVQERDDQIRLANERLSELAASRNEAVQKFNELAARYNGVVDDLNRRTEEYAALVQKYNDLVKSGAR